MSTSTPSPLLKRRGAWLLLGLLSLGGGSAFVQNERSRAAYSQAEVEASLMSWAQRAGELEGTLQIARAREDWLDGEGDRLQAEITRHQREVAETHAQLRALHGREAATRREAQELSRSLEAARRERARLEAKTARQETALTEVQASLESTRLERIRLEASLAAANRTLRAQGAQLSSQATELSARAARLDALNLTLGVERRRLAEARALLRRSERAHEATLAERQRLRSALDEERKAHQRSKADLEAAENATRLATLALAVETKRVETAEGTLDKLKAAGVNVKRLSGLQPLPRLEAIVVRVDAQAVPPQVVIDAGTNQGLMSGDTLHLVRNGRSVGRLVIDELQAGLSTARLVEGERGLVLRPGDQVRSEVPKP